MSQENRIRRPELDRLVGILQANCDIVYVFGDREAGKTTLVSAAAQELEKVRLFVNVDLKDFEISKNSAERDAVDICARIASLLVESAYKKLQSVARYQDPNIEPESAERWSRFERRLGHLRGSQALTLSLAVEAIAKCVAATYPQTPLVVVFDEVNVVRGYSDRVGREFGRQINDVVNTTPGAKIVLISNSRAALSKLGIDRAMRVELTGVDYSCVRDYLEVVNADWAGVVSNWGEQKFESAVVRALQKSPSVEKMLRFIRASKQAMVEMRDDLVDKEFEKVYKRADIQHPAEWIDEIDRFCNGVNPDVDCDPPRRYSLAVEYWSHAEQVMALPTYQSGQCVGSNQMPSLKEILGSAKGMRYANSEVGALLVDSISSDRSMPRFDLSPLPFDELQRISLERLLPKLAVEALLVSRDVSDAVQCGVVGLWNYVVSLPIGEGRGSESLIRDSIRVAVLREEKMKEHIDALNENLKLSVSSIGDRLESVSAEVSRLRDQLGELATSTDLSAVSSEVTKLKKQLEGVATKLEGVATSTGLSAVSGEVTKLEKQFEGVATSTGLSAVSGEVTKLKKQFEGVATSTGLSAVTGEVTKLKKQFEGVATNTGLSAVSGEVTKLKKQLEGVATSTDLSVVSGEVTKLKKQLEGVATSTGLSAVSAAVTQAYNGLGSVASNTANEVVPKIEALRRTVRVGQILWFVVAVTAAIWVWLKEDAVRAEQNGSPDGTQTKPSAP